MILTIGPGGSGLTFLNWSIMYLRGDESYTLLTNKTVDITHNPVLPNKTAHGQHKDHIQTTADLVKIHLATTQSVVYIVPTCQTDMEYILQFAGKKIIFNSVQDSQELMARMIYTIPDNQFTELIANLSNNYDIHTIKQVLIECNKFFTKYYTVPNSYIDYFSIDYQDIFQHLDSRIHDIFKYLELPVSQDRLHNWTSVYTQYRLQNQNFLSEFLNNAANTDNSQKTKIFKEIIQWKNGLYQNT